MHRSIFESAIGRVGSVRAASFSKRCFYLGIVAGRENQLALRGYDRQSGQIILPPHNMAVENFEFRDYIASPDPADIHSEVLYARQFPSHVLRFNVDKRRENEPLPLLDPGAGISSLLASPDGRYVSIGNRHGFLEVWNFDLPRPQRIFARRIAARAEIWSAVFDRSNQRLYVITSEGELLLVEPSSESITTISRYSPRFKPLAVACHPKSCGTVISGSADWLLLLDCPGGNGYSIPLECLDMLPLQYTLGTNVGGSPCYWLSKMPHARLKAMDPGMKEIISVQFLHDGDLVVIGPNEVEIWGLDPLLVKCRTVANSGRPMAIGHVGEKVHVAWAV